MAYQDHALDEICQQCTCGVTSALPLLKEADKRVAKMLTQPGDNGVYWKFRLKGGCWDLMMLTTLDKAPRWITAVRQVAAECGYRLDDMGIYLQPKQRGRAYHLEFNFPVDRGNAGECTKGEGADPSGGKTPAQRRRVFISALRITGGNGFFTDRQSSRVN